MLHSKVLFTPRVKSELTVPQTRMGKTPRFFGQNIFNLGRDVCPGLCWANTAARGRNCGLFVCCRLICCRLKGEYHYHRLHSCILTLM